MDEYRMIDERDASGFLATVFFILKRTLVYTLSSLKKYYLVAILVFAGIVGAGYFWLKANSYTYFESDMTCEFNSLSNKPFGEMVQKLGILVSSHSYTTLAQTLGIPETEARKILSINATNMAGSPLYEDITPDKYPFYITVRASGRSVFAVLQPALVNYLNNSSPFHNNSKELEMASTSGKIAYLKRDIQLADTILIDYGQYLTNGKSVTIADTSAKNSNISSLLKYKDQQENKLLQLEWRSRELNQMVQVLRGFLPPDNPSTSGNGFSKYLVLAGVLLSILVVVCANLLKSMPVDKVNAGKA